jgi:hypothetical protein
MLIGQNELLLFIQEFWCVLHQKGSKFAEPGKEHSAKSRAHTRPAKEIAVLLKIQPSC